MRDANPTPAGASREICVVKGTQTSWPGSEGWEDSGVVTLSAKGIVRPTIGFVKLQTTRYSDFLLGQSQYVDCTAH